MILRERQIRSIQKARKCIWCNEPLIKGDRAVDIFCKSEGFDVTTGAMHSECFEGGWKKEDWDACDYLFYQGGYTRGCCCLQGECKCKEAESSPRG